MPKTPDYFAGKTIIITGAASGIGRATAQIFAREGANVVCADVNEAGVKETAGLVNAKGSQALAVKVDVTSRKQVEDMAERAVDAFGTVHFLFNSAGAAIRPIDLARSRQAGHGPWGTFSGISPPQFGHRLRSAIRGLLRSSAVCPDPEPVVTEGLSTVFLIARIAYWQ